MPTPAPSTANPAAAGIPIVAPHAVTHWWGGDDQLTIDNLMPFRGVAVGDILVASTNSGQIVFRPYSIVVPGGAALRNAFVLDNGDTTPTYKATLDATNPTAVSPTSTAAPGTALIYSHRDHQHGATDIASATTLTNLTTTVNNFIALEYTNAVSANQQLTSNSTAYQNVTNMILPLLANQVWRFSATVVGLSSAAANWKFQFTVPAGATLWFSTGQFTTSAGGLAIYSQVGAGTTVDVRGTGANLPVEVAGTVVCGGTPGNLQLQAAQNTATVETTDFIIAGSNIFGRRVA